MKQENERQLPLGVYLRVWGLIVVLVTLSYLVFLLQTEPLWLRRSLFVAIALIQAVLSVTYFMQLRLERPGLVYAVLLPLILLLALVIFALSEGTYVFGVREAQQLVSTERPWGEPPHPQPASPTEPIDPVERGRQLWQSKGCYGCHTITGEQAFGPTWKGLYGSLRELTDGTTVIADDEYLRESIVNPAAKVVKGFSPMPPMGQFSDEEIQAIIEYIKSLSEAK
jgi:cytochrome c oxidase subunit IV/mono/diheme cytochrome c family protein